MHVFYKKNGGISSFRTNFNGGYSSNYPDNFNRGGVTFKGANITSRLGRNGTCIGTGIRVGRRTTYFRSNYLSDRLTQF